mmetsp:Transcript_29653/g.44617  ORF Transcript_29653/g.44617 Transcript_29653/m.44617 type:complete len:217 (-) Transcript_29653:125-775(-)
MRLRRQELLPTLDLNNNDIMEDSGGMTPAMDNNSKNKNSLGQHCNAIVSLRFVMAISLIFVGGFTVKQFSAVDPSPAHVQLDTTHSYNADKLYDFENVFTQTRDDNDNVVKQPPHGWQTFGFLQIRDHFRCDVFDYVVKPPSMKKWQMILDAYNKEVDSSYKFDQIVPPTQGYLFDKIGAQYNNEGAPPFYAESRNMGRRRGLFASRDIQVLAVVR